MIVFVFFFSSRRRHTRYWRDWSSDVCSSDLVWERVREKGFPFDVTGIRAPDADGTVLFEVPDAKSGGPDYPAVMGMSRPELARILHDRAAEVGVKLRYGITFTELRQDDAGVDVTFTDR